MRWGEMRRGGKGDEEKGGRKEEKINWNDTSNLVYYQQQHRLGDLMVGKGDVKPYINGLALIGLHRELVLPRWLCSKIATSNMLG